MKHKTLNDVLYAAIKSKDVSKEVKEILIKQYLFPKIYSKLAKEDKKKE